MKKKCESCKHHVVPSSSTEFEKSFCVSPKIDRTLIMEAREICDKEWDGRFVYFEEKDAETEPDWTKLVREIVGQTEPGAYVQSI